jgi:hypothetical protein
LIRILAETLPRSPDTPTVTSRSARKHCGTLISEEYRPGIHDSSRRESNSYFPSGYQVKCIDWFMRKGDTIQESIPVQYAHFWEKPVNEGRPTIVTTKVFECGDDIAPKHPTTGAHQIAEVKADFSTIPEADFKRIKGPDGQWYYQIWFEIEMTCYSAKKRFVLVHKQKKYDTVEVDYMQSTDV